MNNNRIKIFLILLISILFVTSSFSQVKLLIPMESSQTDHLKAYGIAYRHLLNNKELDWLLNFRGGSFLFNYSKALEDECNSKGVSFELKDGTQTAQIYAEVKDEDDKNNMDVVRLEKVAKIAVYVPPNALPWDDAVQLVLEYAEIPYDKLWDEEVLTGGLKGYDWLHLHHEDFTGQFGKFFATYGTASWYLQQKDINESMAAKMGYKKVSQLKLAVVKKLKEYIANGGFLFTMCSATDTYDIALAAQYTDICESMYDGDPADADANSKLDFSETIAFENFTVDMNPYVYEYSNIDVTNELLAFGQYNDNFKLVEFSAKYDPVPSMLTQDHTSLISGFLGQTTGFRKDLLKKNVTILGMNEGTDAVKYIHGNYGKGTFTFFGGHDPEDYQHAVGDPKTELKNFPHSPGYRLILNNVLFPAAKKKKLKT
ncbi:MAG TPA: asparagine synthetase B [Ignavibacteria bacterium]|nr:asparagine synthetase B [Ignavibacteria bacterium]HMR39076.1 asparagine synthetase B [Ignavibacteria bacterium]